MESSLNALVYTASPNQVFHVTRAAIPAFRNIKLLRTTRQVSSGEEDFIIEPTERHMQALDDADSTPPRIANRPIEHLKNDEYDNSPWTRGELEALAWETHQRRGWEDWGEYDDDQASPGSGVQATEFTTAR
jgi:hypothetical protein